MRTTAADMAITHSKIIEQAARLFRERGFAEVGVKDVMNEVGLTHGGFYGHFDSKEALIQASIAFMSKSWVERLKARGADPRGKNGCFRDYLSAQHRDAPGEGCMAAALGPEISRDPTTRALFTQHIRSSVDCMATIFPWASEETAWKEAMYAVSTMVGALALSRSVDDDRLSKEILAISLEGLTRQAGVIGAAAKEVPKPRPPKAARAKSKKGRPQPGAGAQAQR